MTAEIFVDTNIWLYASSNAREDRAKREIAREVIRRRGVGLSTQVMQEFYDAAVRKMRLNIAPEAALEILRRMGLSRSSRFLGNSSCVRLRFTSAINSVTTMLPSLLQPWNLGHRSSFRKISAPTKLLAGWL